MTPVELDAVLVAARLGVGLGFGRDRERSERYARWLFPHDDLSEALRMARTSWSCGLEVLAVWRGAHVDAPELLWRYAQHVGSCFASIQAIGERHDALVRLGSEAWEDGPQPGDAVIVGGGSHARVLLSRADDDACVSVDGGQVDSWGKCIAERRWRLTRSGAGAGWSTSDHGAVAWWVSTTRLPQRVP